MPDEQEEPSWKAEWEKEARALRYWRPSNASDLGSFGPSLARQFLLALVLLLVLAGSLWLLIAPAHRQAGLHLLVGGWLQVISPENSSRIYELPPPPLKTVEARPVDVSPVIIMPTEDKVIGETDENWGDEEEAEAPTPVLLKTDAFRAAYTILTSNSQAADRLVKNEIPGFVYKDWKPVHDASPVLWIELTATEEGSSSELSFTWSVNTSDGDVRPLSQAARDLEARVKE